jgi:hypothetical protein
MHHKSHVHNVSATNKTKSHHSSVHGASHHTTHHASKPTTAS